MLLTDLQLRPDEFNWQHTVAGFPTFMLELLNIPHKSSDRTNCQSRLKNKQSQKKKFTQTKPAETVKRLPLNHNNKYPTKTSAMMHYVRSKKRRTNPPLLFRISSIYYFHVRLVLVGQGLFRALQGFSARSPIYMPPGKVSFWQVRV